MVKSKACRDAETMLKNSRLINSLQKVQKSETQGNPQKPDFVTHHKCCSEISRLNDKFPRPTCTVVNFDRLAFQALALHQTMTMLL